MIAGVDISSRAIHLAWLQDGRPCRWHQDISGGNHDDHLIDRLRRIRVQWPTSHINAQHNPDGTHTMHGADVTDIAIEYPFGRGNAIAALMATVGVITRQAPPWARVAWPSSQELRAAIGARNNKMDAHCIIRTWYPSDFGANPGCLDWDEHELDALVACLGWTRILAAQDAA